jgi:hypothetical protein
MEKSIRDKKSNIGKSARSTLDDSFNTNVNFNVNFNVFYLRELTFPEAPRGPFSTE